MLQGQPLHPLSHALQIFTDTSKEEWGAHLGKHTARGAWSLSENKLQLSEVKGSLLGPERVPRPLLEPNSSHGYRYHHSGRLNKQGRRHEIGLTECPSVEDPDLVFQKTGYS